MVLVKGIVFFCIVWFIGVLVFKIFFFISFKGLGLYDSLLLRLFFSFFFFSCICLSISEGFIVLGVFKEIKDNYYF